MHPPSHHWFFKSLIKTRFSDKSSKFCLGKPLSPQLGEYDLEVRQTQEPRSAALLIAFVKSWSCRVEGQTAAINNPRKFLFVLERTKKRTVVSMNHLSAGVVTLKWITTWRRLRRWGKLLKRAWGLCIVWTIRKGTHLQNHSDHQEQWPMRLIREWKIEMSLKVVVNIHL